MEISNPNKAILAIDPGNKKSAVVIWNGKEILNAFIDENINVLHYLKMIDYDWVFVVIEKVACYGMPVGVTVFDTVYWSGRFAEASANRMGEFYRMERRDVKLHMCNSARAKDSNVRQVLIDRYGKPPTKKDPNPVYNDFKIAKDMWQAWALAVTYDETKGFYENRKI